MNFKIKYIYRGETKVVLLNNCKNQAEAETKFKEITAGL